MRILTLISLLLMSIVANAAVYKWVDKDGKVHYSDEPKDNAQVVELKENTQNEIALDVTKETSMTEPKEITIDYQLKIISPSEEETIRDNSGDFDVIASITPELTSRQFFVLRLDDKIYGDPQTSPVFSLKGVDRGEHKLVVQAVAQNGKVLASSSTRTIFLHQASQVLKPKPTPKTGG